VLLLYEDLEDKMNPRPRPRLLVWLKWLVSRFFLISNYCKVCGRKAEWFNVSDEQWAEFIPDGWERCYRCFVKAVAPVTERIEVRVVKTTPLLSDRDWIEDCVKWRGHVLTGQKAHWCQDWDGLPVDETTPEIGCCHCYDPQKEDVSNG